MTPNNKKNSPNGKRLLASKQAALKLRCAPDYIGKLCREGKLQGTQIDRVWYVDPDSLRRFQKEREEAKVARAEELAADRRREIKAVPKSPRLQFISAAGAVLLYGGLMLVASGAISQGIQRGAVLSQSLGASLAQVESPFFGTRAYAVSLPEISGSFFTKLFSFFGRDVAQQPAEEKKAESPVAQTVNNITNNTTNNYTTTNNSTTYNSPTSYISTSGDTAYTKDFDAKLNTLRSEIYSRTPSGPPSSGGAINNIALSQIINKLSGVTISNSTVDGLSGLTDSDIPDGITVANYLPLAGGTLTGTLTGTSAVFATAASTTDLTVSGTTTLQSLASCTLKTDSSGAVTCGTDLQGSSEGNWSYFNGSGIRLATTSNQVVVGSTSTSTSYKFEVVGGAVLDNATTTSLSVSGLASTSNLVVSNAFTFGNLTGFLKATAGAIATSTISLVNDIAGILGISNGGTGTSTAPSYGQLLVGNSSGGYDLLATSSLGITSAAWGNITGTLADQTDLQAALDAKLSLSAWYATTTDGLDEGLVNRYYSDTLARAALSASAPLVYNNLTGAFSIAQSGTAADGYLSSTDWNTFNNKISSSSLSQIFPFTPTTNYGAAANSTSTPIWFAAGLQASSTSHFVYASTTALTVSGTGYFGTATTTALNVSGTATFQSLAATLLSTNATGVAQTTTVSAPLSFSGSTLSIAQSGTATDGYLSSTDWSVFNNKISSSSLSATFPLAYNSTTGAFTFNGLSTSTAAVIGNIAYFSGANTFANVATSAPTVSSPLAYSGTLGAFVGGAGGAFSIAQSGTATDGYLSSTDWNVFNQKVSSSSLTTALNAAYPFALTGNATSTLTQFNGGLTSYASSTIGAGGQITGLTISGGATTTGNSALQGTLALTGAATLSSTLTLSGTAANIILGSNWLSGDGGDEGVFVSSDGNVGIATTTPSANTVGGGRALAISGSGAGVRLNPSAAGWAYIDFLEANASKFIMGHRPATGNFSIVTGGSLAAGAGMTMNTSGHVGFGTLTPTSLLHIRAPGNTWTDTTNPMFELWGADNQTEVMAMRIRDENDNEYFRVSSTGVGNADTGKVYVAGKLGIGTTTPYAKLSVVGQAVAEYFTATSTIATNTFPLLTATTATTTNFAVTGVTSSLLKTNSLGQLLAAVAGTDYANFAYPFALAGNATSTLTQFNGGLTAYASSTIGNGTQAGGLTISGGATTTGNAYFAGRIGIGTQSPVQTLDVNGTAKVSSTFTLGGVSSCLGSSALQTDASGNVSCGAISASSGVSSAGGWETNNIGKVSLATSTDLVVVGATSTPYARFTVISGSTATTTLAILAASGQTADILHFYDQSGAISTRVDSNGAITAASLSLNSALGVGSGGTGASTFSYGLLLSPGGTGALTNISTSSLGLLTTNVAEGSNLYYTDARVNSYISASTTIPKTYSANTFTGANTFNSTLTVGSLNGPLQSNNGLVSATTSIGVLYGGTGLTAAPSYGNILVGNALSGYTLTGTSSLGLLGSSSLSASAPLSYNQGTGAFSITQSGTATDGYLSSTDWNTFNNKISSSSLSQIFPFTPTTNYGAAANSTSTPVWFQSGLQASSTSQFVYASSTALTVSGTGYFGTASTSNLTISLLPGTILSTNSTGVAQTTTVSAPLSFSGSTLSISQSAAAADGYLSSTDWNVFNNKISSSSLSATFPLAYNSTTGAFTFNGLSTSTAAVIGNIAYFSGANTFANVATSAPTVSSPLAYSGTLGAFVGGAGGAFSIAQSGTATDGYLSSTDWNVFNQKVSTSSLLAQYPFQLTGNATSTLTQFNGGLTAYASSTIGNGTQIGGLTISGGATTTGNAYFAGNVGIGTASPTGKLNVASSVGVAPPLSATANLTLTDTSALAADNGGALVFNFNYAAGQLLNGGPFVRGYKENATDGNYASGLKFGTRQNGLASAVTMTLNGSGYLGIGTTSPSYALDVAGFINTDQYSGFKQAGNTILYASSTNFSTLVGQGAGSNYMALATAGLHGTAVGYQALGGVLTTAAVQNTAVGYNTLFANTSGSNNTALGHNALAANTTGTGNTAFGSAALSSNVDGVSNLAFGLATLQSNVSGSRNIGIGASALNVNTASDNIGIGSNALTANTSGSTNVGIGISSLTSNISGSNNVGLGYTTLQYNTTGASNTALGSSASRNNNSATSTVAIGQSAGIGSGAYNAQGYTAIGYQAGANFATGSDYNTLLGYQAGYNVTTGAHNTILGYSGTTGGITTGSDNILIGDDVRNGLTVTSSNQLNIGNLLFSNSVGTGATAATGNIGVGTSTPWGKLSVTGAGTGTGVNFLLADSANSPIFKVLDNGSITATGAFTSSATTANTFPYASSTALTVSGHCVTADTRLRRRRRRADGSYEYDEPEIVDIEEGDEIQSLDERTGEMVWSRVRKLMFMGVKQTYRIVTEDGRTIRTTAEHPYLVKNAKGKWLKHHSPIEKAGWATVANLREGDEIAVVSRENSSKWAHSTRLDNKTFASQRFWSAAFKKLLALPEQGLASKVLNIDDNDARGIFGVKFTNVSEVVVGSEKNIAMFPRVLKNIRIGSRGQSDVAGVGQTNIGKEAQSIAHIAVDTLVRENGEHGLGVRDAGENLRGTLQNAGSKLNRGLDVLFGNSFVLSGDFFESIAGADEVENIGNSNTRPANRGFAETDVSADGNALVHKGNSIPNAPYVSNEEIGQSFAWSKIRSIEPIAEEDVYDIEVEGTHNFIGNDIVAHNTYLGNLLASASSTIGAGTQAGGLTISGGATTTGNAYFAGNVGIGTSTSAANLQVTGGSSPLFTLGDAYASTANLQSFQMYAFSSGDNYFDTKTQTSGKTHFRTGQGTQGSSNAEWMTVDATTAYVGMGSTTPWGKLSVQQTGTGGAPSFIVADQADDTTPFVIDQTGNVGIGTTSPYAKLSVDGRGVFNQDIRADYYTATSTSVASTFPYASSTALTVSGTGYFDTASTSNLSISGISSCSSTQALTTNASGVVSCGTISGTGGSFPFTATTNYGAAANSTSTPIWFTAGLQASSTSRFVYASSTALTVSGNFYGAGLSTCASGADKLLWTGGSFSCGTDSGASGTSEINWAFFNGSGVRLGTTTNQVLIGATATSSGVVPLAKLNVIGGAGFDAATSTSFFATTASSTNLTVGSNEIIWGNLGLGSSSPSSRLSILGGNITQQAAGAPTFATTTYTANNTYASVVQGRYVYVADNVSGLQIFENSNPRKMALVGTYSGISGAVSVAVAGRYAYVGDSAAGLVIVDVSNPSAPALMGSYAGGDAFGIALSGKYAFVSNYTGGKVNVVDVSDPRSPKLASSTYMGGNPYGLAVQGKYLYVANQANGKLQIVDISNPSAPAIVGTYSGGTNPTGVYVSGKYAYVADAGKGLLIVDISNSASPTLTGSYDTSTAYYGVSVAGNYAYAADNAGFLKVIDISNPASPQAAGTYTLSAGLPLGVTVSGKYAYVAADTSGLNVIDINGIDSPAANIGSIAANTVDISDTLSVGNTIYAGGGLDVGISGIFSRGTISAFIASTTQSSPTVANFMGGNVGIGTSSPYAALSVTGQSVFNYITATGTTASTFAGAITSTATAANTFPYASTTALTVSGTGYFGTATTTALNVSGTATFQNLASAGLAVNSSGVVYAAATTTFSGGLTYLNGNVTNTLTAGDGLTRTVDDFDCDTANSTTFGCLAAADWSVFNNKISSSSLSAGAGISYNSTTGVITNTIAYPFTVTGNATSTLTQFNGGLTAYASSTIGNGTQAGGLTISGGATTTGNAYFAGNVGIGTASPGSAIDFGTSQSNVRKIISLYHGGNRYSGFGQHTVDASPVMFGSSDDAYDAIFGNLSSADGTTFSTHAVITNAGNVGIGTTTPWGKLSVTGGGTGTGQAFVVADSANTPRFSVLDNGKVGIGTVAPVTTFQVGGNAALSSLTSDINASVVTDPAALIVGKNLESVGALQEPILTLFRQGSPGTLYPHSAAFYLGRNTGHTDTALNVVLGAQGATTTVMGWTFDGTTPTTNYYGSQVMSGLLDGAALLSINDTSNNTVTSQGKMQFKAGGTITGNISGMYDSGALSLNLGAGGLNTRHLTIVGVGATLGNVGIGTTTPYAKLSVDGRGVFNQDVRANYFTATSTSVASTFPYASTTALTVSGIGYFGTATTTALNVSGTATFQNLASAGLAVNSSGVVYAAATTTFSGGLTYLNGNVTNTLTAGDGLTRTVDDFDCDTANSSTFGCLAAADWNVFNNKISSSSLSQIFPFTPTTNYGAAANSTSTPIWFTAGLQSSSTIQSSGFINTSGITGGFKIDGNLILQASSTVHSVFLGKGAGTSANGSSDYNTLLGYNAGNLITTGANNTLLGAASTGSNENLTTGSGNIKIGYNISFPSATANNQLNIGNILYGTAIDGSGSTLSTGNVGIGTTTPGQKLSVAGDILGNNIIGSYFTGTSTTASSFLGGLTAYASSTIGAGTQAGGLTISGGATTTGFLAITGTTGTTTIAAGQGFTIGSSQFVLQQGSGNVGIGTSSPTRLLSIQGTSGYYFYLSAATGFQNVTSGTNAFANFGVPVGGARIMSFYNSAGAEMSNVSQNGAFAIGIVGNNVALGSLQVGSSTTALPTSITARNNYVNVGGNNYGANGYANIGFGYNPPGGSNTYMPAYFGYQEKGSAANTYGDLVFGTRNVTTDTLPTERMRIDNAGNVGIGTTTPAQLLSVGGNVIIGASSAGGTNGTLTYGGVTLTNAVTGTGKMVLDTSPTLVTPVLGAATYTTLSGGNITDSALTSGRVTFASTGGLLVDDTDLTFSTDTLTATKLLAPTSVSTPSLISTAAITATPAAGSNFNIALSTTGDFVVNTDDLYVDTSTGNVGIGTASPSQKLHVAGNGLIGTLSTYDAPVSANPYLHIGDFTAGATTANGELLIGHVSSSVANDVLGQISFYSSDDSTTATGRQAAIKAITEEAAGRDAGLAFFTGTGTEDSSLERVRIDSNGNVGIGTTPNNKLDVQGGALQIGAGIGNTYATRSNAVVLNRTDLPTSWLSYLSYSLSGTPADTTLNFELADSASTQVNVMTLNAAGNVGIGSTTPSMLLSIGSVFGVNSSGAIIQNATGAGNVWVQGGIEGSTGDDRNLALFGHATNDDLILNYSNEYDCVSVGGTSCTNALDVDGGGSFTGNVGIGSSTPYAKLSVTNTGTGPSFIVEDSTSPDTTPFIIDASGNVGIGDASPAALLTVGDGDLFQVSSTGAISTTLTTRQLRLGYSSSMYADFTTNSAGALTIQPTNASGAPTGANLLLNATLGGNVGIGDTSPDYLLDVAGDAGFDGLLTMTGAAANIALGSNFLSGDGGDEGIAVDTGGNVTITAGYLTNSTASPVATAGDADIISGDTVSTFQYDQSAGVQYFNRSSENATSFDITGRKSRGSIGSEVNVNSGDDLFRIRAYGLNNDPGGGSTYVESSSITFDTEGDINAAVPGVIRFKTADSAGTLTERMTINSTGYVGIGDTSPDYLLDVAGAAGFDGLLTMTGSAANIALGSNFLSGDGGDEGVSVNSSGNVGIGLTDPTSPLTVAALGRDAGDYDYDQLTLRSLRSAFNATAATSLIGGINFDSNDTSLTAPGTTTAAIKALATEGHTTTALGTALNFYTTKNTTIVPILAATMQNDGDFFVTGSVANCTLGDGTAASNCSVSDRRLKDTINPITNNEGLSSILRLNPVTFYWNSMMQENGSPNDVQYGLVAQEVQEVFPTLVRDGGRGYFTLDYQGLSGPIIKAIQELNLNLETIASTTASSTPASQAFAASFFNNLFTRMTAWLGTASNGLADLFATHVHAQVVDADTVNTQTLCIGGTCVTETQLQALLAGAGNSGQGVGNSGGTTTTSNLSTTTSDVEAPVITLSGNNPSTVDVGAVYADLGATISDNVNDNLGYYASVDGGATTTPDSIYIDTTAGGTHYILFSSTDQAGNVGTATRTVIVGDGSPEVTPTESPAEEPVTPPAEPPVEESTINETATSTPLTDIE